MLATCRLFWECEVLPILQDTGAPHEVMAFVEAGSFLQQNPACGDTVLDIDEVQRITQQTLVRFLDRALKSSATSGLIDDQDASVATIRIERTTSNGGGHPVQALVEDPIGRRIVLVLPRQAANSSMVTAMMQRLKISETAGYTCPNCRPSMGSTAYPDRWSRQRVTKSRKWWRRCRLPRIWPKNVCWRKGSLPLVMAFQPVRFSLLAGAAPILGDFNLVGVVDAADMGFLLGNWTGDSILRIVPEPVMPILCLSGLLLSVRRRCP